MEANFLYLANTLGTSLSASKDHQISVGGVDTNSFEGRHRQVSLKNQLVANVLGALSDGANSVLFSFNNEVYYTNATASPSAIQLTSAGISVATLANGRSFLPGGIMIAWGTVTIGGASSGTVNFAATVGISFPTAIFGVQTTLVGSSSQDHIISVSAQSVTSFSWHWNGSTSYPSFFWTAIGN